MIRWYVAQSGLVRLLKQCFAIRIIKTETYDLRIFKERKKKFDIKITFSFTFLWVLTQLQ